VLFEASQECVRLRRMIDNIQISCDIGAIGSSIIIYEDNVACVVQMQMRHIETNYTKLFIQKIIHINYKRVERLVSCKFNHTIIMLIRL
jgi:hypothetical protein